MALNGRAGLPWVGDGRHPDAMKRALVVLAIALGCDSGDDGPGGPCADRSGAYQVDLVAESGTCASTSFIVTGGDELEPGCVGSVAPSADNCSVVVDMKCNDAAAGDEFQMTGKITWNVDSSRASGKVSVSTADRYGVGCSGLYRVTYTRL
jgi:hypothetical protein